VSLYHYRVRTAIGSIFPALLCVTACAHAPINKERQDAYFTCPNVQVGDAEAHLASAGWPISNASEFSVTTAYRPIAIGGDHMLAVLGENHDLIEKANVGKDRYQVRIIVGRAAPAGVRFHIYQTIHDREIDWDAIYDEQVSHDATRNELNRYRIAVCGGEPFFGH